MTQTDPTTPAPPGEAAGIQAYLIDRIAFYLSMPVEEISLDVPVTEFGLDSVYAIALCADIEDELGVTVEPTLLWDIDTVTDLTAHLGGLLAAQPAG
ncbi:acyl carrier protein [Kitasatospora sp. NPDC006697]|uniref:acyl carrier protein n=1 Tax=Kitasatospora sp. NPDC006697 TaxID=3364020 RepID=UPI0036C3C2F5